MITKYLKGEDVIGTGDSYPSIQERQILLVTSNGKMWKNSAQFHSQGLPALCIEAELVRAVTASISAYIIFNLILT